MTRCVEGMNKEFHSHLCHLLYAEIEFAALDQVLLFIAIFDACGVLLLCLAWCFLLTFATTSHAWSDVRSGGKCAAAGCRMKRCLRWRRRLQLRLVEYCSLRLESVRVPQLEQLSLAVAGVRWAEAGKNKPPFSC